MISVREAERLLRAPLARQKFVERRKQSRARSAMSNKIGVCRRRFFIQHSFIHFSILSFFTAADLTARACPLRKRDFAKRHRNAADRKRRQNIKRDLPKGDSGNPAPRPAAHIAFNNRGLHPFKRAARSKSRVSPVRPRPRRFAGKLPALSVKSAPACRAAFFCGKSDARKGTPPHDRTAFFSSGKTSSRRPSYRLTSLTEQSGIFDGKEKFDSAMLPHTLFAFGASAVRRGRRVRPKFLTPQKHS